MRRATALRIRLALQLRKGGHDGLIEVVGEAVDQLEGEILSLRSLITALRPMALDDTDLKAAIEDLAERARRDGLEVELRIDLANVGSGRHGTELETTVYRVTQEALTNARKHGRAQHALVEIQDRDHYVRLTVRDDGRGFDPQAKADGFGLAIMRERAELLGGRLEVSSAPGQGTQIVLDLPVRQAARQRAS